MRQPYTGWSQEEIDYLLKHVALRTRRSAIAKALGRTKSSVIGKCNRLGVSERHKGTRPLPYLGEYTTWQYKRDNPWNSRREADEV